MRRSKIVASVVAAGAVTLGVVPLVGTLSNADASHEERSAAAISDYDNPLAAQAEQVLFYRYIGALSAAEAQARAAAARGRGGGGGGARCVEHPVSYGDGQYSVPGEIVQRESGGNYGSCNESTGACGAYQVMPSTWDGYGGYASACDAPESVQDQWAAEAYAQAGTQPWGG